MSIENLLQLFVDCSICVGYGHTSGRTQLADEVSGDIEKILSEIKLLGPQALLQMETLLAPQENPWVRYHAASALLTDFPEKAVHTLEELSKVNGMVSPLAWLQLTRVHDQK